MSIYGLNGANSISANGSEQSVQSAQTAMEQSMNKASVMQMQMLEKQTVRQLNQQAISNNLEMVNSAKQQTEKIRL